MNHGEMDGGSANIHGRLDRKSHFEAVRQQLLASAQTRAQAQGVNRHVQGTAHEDCLAVSWAGDREYRLALAFSRDWAAAQKKLKIAAQVFGRLTTRAAEADEKEAVIRACRSRYDGKLDTAYACEAYVFQKTSEVPPRAVETVAPGLLCELGSVPLHHYYLISREQPVVDEGEAPVFTRWRLEPKTYATLDVIVEALMARMYPERCPPLPIIVKFKFPRETVLWILASVLLGASVLAAGVWLERSKWFEEITGRFEDLEDDLQSINAGQQDLDARYAALEAELAALAGDVARRSDVARILAELEALERGSRSGFGEPSQASSTGVLGRPPCAVTPTDGGSPALGYLARVHLSDDGIRVYGWNGPSPARGADQREAALRTLDFSAAQPMTAEAFRAWAAPAHALSDQAGCRHYVVVNETGLGSAADYARMRDAVEDNFYIWRAAS